MTVMPINNNNNNNASSVYLLESANIWPGRL